MECVIVASGLSSHTNQPLLLLGPQHLEPFRLVIVMEPHALQSDLGLVLVPFRVLVLVLFRVLVLVLVLFRVLVLVLVLVPVPVLVLVPVLVPV